MRKDKCFFIGAVIATATVAVTTNTIKKRNKEFKLKGRKNDGINNLPKETGTDLDWQPQSTKRKMKFSDKAFV